jgi:hypothetical protein
LIAHWFLGCPMGYAVTGLTDQMDYLILITFNKELE